MNPVLAGRPSAERDLVVSLFLLSGIVVVALAGLATDGNWPKILRVGTALAAYFGVMALQLRRSAPDANRSRLPWLWFVTAGIAAGVLSNLVRPETNAVFVVSGAIGGAVLSSVHHLAIHQWRRGLPAR